MNFFEMRRKQLKLSQRRLGIRLDMTDSAIGMWERGLSVPRLSMAGELASAYEAPREKIEAEIIRLSRKIAAKSA